jgi:hypothetical protein
MENMIKWLPNFDKRVSFSKKISLIKKISHSKALYLSAIIFYNLKWPAKILISAFMLFERELIVLQ